MAGYLTLAKVYGQELPPADEDTEEGDEYVKRVVRVAPEAEASSSPLPQVEAPVYIYKDSPAALLGPWSYDQVSGGRPTRGGEPRRLVAQRGKGGR